MAISEELRALNVEIAEQETAKNTDWFGTLLAPSFTMRRASGALVDKKGFLEALKSSDGVRRQTPVVAGTELDATAAVSCVVSMKQSDGSWKGFRNNRLFVRSKDGPSGWQLLAWANEPIDIAAATREGSEPLRVGIIEQVPLEFAGDKDKLKALRNLSAIYCDDDTLWAACDELAELERLTLSTDSDGAWRYSAHESFPLGALGVVLPDGDDEVDAEGMDLVGRHLWLVGSHSSTRKSLEVGDNELALKAFAEVRKRPNRHVLLRIEVERDGQTATSPVPKKGTAALLLDELTVALKKDPYLKPSTKAPAKENGLDVEGLAVCGDHVLVGLRGPVLRGWAVVLELKLQDAGGSLALGDPPRYRKHFLELGELGVRDLCRDGNDLLILAGPSMGLDGPVRVYRWRNAAKTRDRELVADDDVSVVAELPFGDGDDHAEGITVISGPNEQTRLLVVYDSPAKNRLTKSDGKLSILADITSPLPPA
jgi:hypothetical protein